VVTSTVRSADDGQAGASSDLRVPSTRLDSALAELSKLAHVPSRTRARRTSPRATCRSQERLRESRAEREALLRQLARADSEAEAESVRARLRIVNGELAARRAEVSRLNERASFATVLVTETGESGSGTGNTWTPRDALRDAARVLEWFAAVLVVVLAIGGPVLLVVGGAAYVASALRRRRREQVLDRA
jgi:Domain of unknown function (DUF4349)